MSEKIKIEAVKDPRGWENNDGTIRLTFYTLTILKADGDKEEVDHSRKQGLPPPQPGEELEVEFEPGKFRPKMKKAKQGSGGSKDSSPYLKPQPPDAVARMGESAAHGHALTALSLSGYSNDGDWDNLKEAIAEWTNWFTARVNKAGEAAKQGADKSEGAGPLPSPSPASRTVRGSGVGVPAGIGNTPGPGQRLEQDENAQFLDACLDKLGITDLDDRRWLVHAWDALNKEKRAAALKQLTNEGDLESQKVALKRLWQLAGPIPEYFRDPAKEIPFHHPEYREAFSERERWRF